MLYIVSTPIGNLKDISFRAIETLKKVDLIAAEDTRHTKKLLNEYQITTPVTSYFDHNKSKKGEQLLAELQAGKTIALVSDAGTPGINDPGYRLVNLAKTNGIAVHVVPGAVALIAALSLSGLPTDAFIFEGFLPVKSAGRKKKFLEHQAEGRTVIFYESPHRIIKALADLAETLSDPKVVVVREISKKFEEVLHDHASQLLEHFTKHKPKGEFVLLFNLRMQDVE